MRIGDVENYRRCKNSPAPSTAAAKGGIAQPIDQAIGIPAIPNLLKMGISGGRGNSTSEMRRLSVDRIESTLQTDS